LENFKGLGSRLNESKLLENLDLDILEVYPKGEQTRTSKKLHRLQCGDTLRIRGGAKDIAKLVKREDIAIKPTPKWRDVDFTGGELSLVEVVIAPDSSLESKKIKQVSFAKQFEAIVLALRSRGRLVQEDLGEIRLAGGDSLLLYVNPNRIEELKRDSSFVVVSQIGYQSYRRKKLPIAFSVLAGIIITVALGIFPISVAAVTGSILLIILGCLNMQEALSAINWKVIFLLAGVLPLGIAMDKTGAAMLLSNWLLQNLQRFGPQIILAGFFLLSMLLTNLISNQATAALLAPIAIKFANDIGANPRAFLIAIAFAASLSFMTPVGYQTNTLILGPGNYKFIDFLKVGLPLNLILWIVASLLIPLYWPL
jgi:di/tricarboxylate transporter